MAGAFGYKFIFFSAVFYLFLGMVLALGAGQWLLDTSISSNTTYSMGNYTTNITEVTPSTWDYASFILQNPFSGISWLAWLSLAILITDLYIIITSSIP